MIIFFGLFIHSPLLAGSCVTGSILGLCTGMVFDAPPLALRDGIWGYNPALTACAVATFFKPTWQMFVLMVFASIMTQIAAAGMGKAVATAVYMPVATVPFCLAAVFLYLLHGKFMGIELADGTDERKKTDEEEAPDLEEDPKRDATRKDDCDTEL